MKERFDRTRGGVPGGRRKRLPRRPRPLAGPANHSVGLVQVCYLPAMKSIMYAKLLNLIVVTLEVDRDAVTRV